MGDEITSNHFPNGNHETSPSNGNELLYFTAESDILNVSNDSVNQCLLKTQNENINLSTLSNDSFTVIEKSGDSNCNPVENLDLSITDAFAKMMLSNNSVNDDTMKSVSCSSEPLDNKFDEVPKNELDQQSAINPVIEESTKSLQKESTNVNMSDAKMMLSNNSLNDVTMKSVSSVSSEPLDNNSDEILKDKVVPQSCNSPVLEESSKSHQEESPEANMPDPIVRDEVEQNPNNDLIPEKGDLLLTSVSDSPFEKNDDVFCKVDVSPLVDNNSHNVEKSPELEAELQSTSESSAVTEKVFSPNFSGGILSEQTLSFMTGGDTSNELSASLPDKSVNVSDHEISEAVKQDDEKHLIPENINVISNIVSTNDDGIFKIPAIPVKVTEPKVKSPHALSNDSGDFPNINANEMSVFEANTELTSDNLLFGHSDFSNDKNNLLFDAVEPCKLSEVEVTSSGLPEPRVFTDFREVKNDFEENPFKIPEPPKDDDEEEFTDAVQFFKDPSSFQYLENIQTSVPADSIPRSSLYVAFDPLHSKRASVSQVISTPNVQLIAEPESDVSTPVKKHLVDPSLRESLGVLISFDSPKPSTKVVPEENEPMEEAVTKQYTEEELQQILKIHELTMQETYLKKHRELEQEMAKAEEKNNKLSSLVILFKNGMEEISGVLKTLVIRNDELASKADDLEKENEKLKDDVRTAGEDLQSVESTFSDFHKRYEQCKGMLKTYKENEAQLKSKLSEQEQKYNALQEQSHEALEKATMEAMVAKKSSEGQVTVLKAQLKKAELKISSLESDLSQVKIENSKLGGICDDLMAKVSEG